ncbi:hypothetical protein ATO10_11797 [Actibacterium atlanticum]|uniref:FAD assembly factor SdhE n=1 Tax=Actibacterium atlanticum TaxID=1461693 RepID=A0A058ZIZ2_9RHOB|nr:succinate dehydrogenase assembly factor 2 [Actibacterium atlanticum]KCV81594.1 hypothetical protein ATO10_11797 [Actibacterium atlanticum]
MAELREHRLKRMKMRAWHRGMKEMDFILGRFSDDTLHSLSDADLDALDALMEENDQDLYKWVSGQEQAPAQHQPLIETIARHAGAL